MKIGVPKEIKTNENRVALVPSGVEALVAAGHSILIESGAGLGSGFSDEQYTAVGAQIAPDADATWASSELLVKVKEPVRSEWHRIRKGQTVFTYFHFAADRELTQAHLDSGATCIAYETVQLPSGELPLLTPMSEVAGRMAVHVVILGGGVVGSHAAKMAAGLGARVTILDLSLDRLRYLSEVLPSNVQTIFSNRHNLLEQIATADLVVGGVLIPGATAPRLIRREDLKTMREGAVIVDVAVDQGGCVETTRPTTHQDPVYIIDGVVHYAVANMPGGVPRTSTLALTNATLPYLKQLANKGWKQALRESDSLRLGLNIVDGKICYKAVADAFNLPYTAPETFL
jgi:alanine dehydrogenase